MIEVSDGLLLGSEGDAHAVVSRKRSITKQYTITHILSITNEPPDWLNSNQSDAELESADKENEGGAKQDVVGGAKGGVMGGAEKEVEGVAKGGSRGETEEVKGGVMGEAERQIEGGVEGRTDIVSQEGVKNEIKDEVKNVGNDEAQGRTKDKLESSSCKESKFKTLFIQATDLPQTDILHHFEKCCRFIQQGIEQGAILVHWSATIVLAYLMWTQGRPLEQIYKELVAKKQDIRPNSGFMEQLRLWGAMRCRIDPKNKAYKLYRLKHLAKTLHFQDVQEIRNAMSADPNAEAQDSTAYYRCRKCRRLLFTEESLLQHDVGEGQAAFKWNKRSDSPSNWSTDSAHSSKLEEKMCSSYFIEPVEWMEEMLIGNTQGKVVCPKCSSRLGSFSWVGQKCSCGQWVNPSFQIHKGKVDETRSLHRRKVNTQK